MIPVTIPIIFNPCLLKNCFIFLRIFITSNKMHDIVLVYNQMFVSSSFKHSHGT